MSIYAGSSDLAEGGLSVHWIIRIPPSLIDSFHQSILQVAARDVVQGCPGALKQYIASFPSTPDYHPEAIAYMQIRSHQTMPASHFQRTMHRLPIRPRVLRRLCLLHCTNRLYLSWSCVSRALPRRQLEGYVISRHEREDLMMLG